MKSLGVQALALLLGMLLLSPAILAHENEEEWEDEDRELDVDSDDAGFEVRSEHGADADRDRISLRLDGDNVAFEFELTEGDDLTEVEAELEVEMERILEFRDENGDGIFQASDDIREEYGPGDLVFTNVTVVNVTSGGVDGMEVTARYSFVDFPTSFLVFRVTAFGNMTTFQGLQQRPVELKLDIIFESFPYTALDTVPAIGLEVKTETPEETNLTGDQVEFSSGNMSAIFSWKRVATVDGVDRDVGVTVGPAETETELGEVEVTHDVTFAYARGDNITHDPTFGFARTPAIVSGVVAGVLGNALFFAVGILAAVTIFGTLAFARRRKSKD